ncbi:MAG: trehalase family glycosidase [Gemmatimonadales bacterium]
MAIGAFDPAAWSGIVLSDRPGRGFAIRFAIERDGERADGYDFMHIVHEVGPHAPDGSYARISFDTYLPLGKGRDTPTVTKTGRVAGLKLEWSVVDRDTVVGRLDVSYSGTLELRGYFPWDWEGAWLMAPNPWETTSDADLVVISGVTSDGESSLSVKLRHSSNLKEPQPATTAVDQEGDAVVTLVVTRGDRVYFTASMSEDEPTTPLHSADGVAVDAALTSTHDSYDATRVRVQGPWEGLASSISNNLNWMVSIKPESGRRYTPAGRRWIFPRAGGGRDHWTTFCWDSFLNALELGIESHELARDTLLAVLETQYGNGNIPNWRGRFAGTPDRSQPPVGSFAVLKQYLRTGDRSLLETAFPYLERWSEWWRAPKGRGTRRDGNNGGLYQWGCDLELLGESPAPWENEASHHQMAAWESGQDDLPNWDDAHWVEETQTFDLDCVDLNSLLALDFDCLSLIASELGKEETAARYRGLYAELTARINGLLWDDVRGMYLDRLWNGDLSPRVAASNFYALLAGIAEPEQAARMLETLLDKRKFWGPYVIPTISRDDPAFNDQQYWRGSIWPPTNYLVYEGLRRYRFDEVAGELASRSVELFLRSWRDYQLCRENYDSRTGEGGGHTHQSWGPLFALIGIEEFIDVTPWEGLRIGSLTPPPKTSLENMVIRGTKYDVAISSGGIHVTVNGAETLRSDGPLVLRQAQLDSDVIVAETLSLEPVTLAVLSGGETVRVKCDGKATESPARQVRVPAGTHHVSISPRNT